VIKARALICDEQQNVAIREVDLPEPGDGQISIRTVYSGVSIGTEFALIRNKISWGPYPLCTGYMGTGIVEKVGAGITNFKAGDKVYFRANAAMTLADGTSVSCVSGTHCSHVVIAPNTTHGADHMPDGAPMDVASMFTLPAVGLYGVDMAGPKMGQVVVVNGCGLIGLGVIAACSHRGCVVIAVDVNPKQLATAKTFGADYLIDAAKQNVNDEVRAVAAEGADAVFESTGIPACINPAIALCRTGGSLIWQGNYGNAPVTLNFMAAHGRCLRMFFPCDDGWQPCRRAVIKNMADGTLKWDRAITHRISYQDAPVLYDRINQGDKDITGVIIKWE